MKRNVLAVMALLVVAAPVARAADTLTQNLQQGLFEEEANHNYDAAIKSYQTVISQADEHRKIVATALFRLGECYRKLGRTNEAAAQFQRVIRDFGDQEQLVKLSQQNISATPSIAATNDARFQFPIAQEAQALNRIQAMVKDSPDLVNSRIQSSGDTPLHSAAESGYLSVVQFLIANHATLNVENLQRQTPLHRAVAMGRKQVVELLTESGADLERKDNTGATPLHIAAANGALGIVEILVGHKANMNGWGPGGDLPIHIAAEYGYANVAKVLLNNGAEVDGRSSDGSTALHRSARRGNTEVTKLLLQHKADLNSQDKGGYTPLSYATRNGHIEVVKVLLEAGADTNLKGRTAKEPLFGVTDTQILRLLLDRKANPNLTHPDTSTALGELIAKGPFAAPIEMLLKHGADPNAVAYQNVPLIIAAVAHRNLVAVELLLEHGANPNVLLNGQTPLSTVRERLRNMGPSSDNAQVRTEDERIEKLLLDRGATEDLVRLSKITYSRPNWKYNENWIIRGTNDFNRYTLNELLGSLWTVPRVPPSPSGSPALPFPDLANITILRLDPKSSKNSEIQVNMDEAVNAEDCSKDVWLEWGDQVFIPELDHPLNERWEGPPQEVRSFLEKCLTRRVQIIVKGTTNTVKLTPNIVTAPTRGRLIPGQATGQATPFPPPPLPVPAPAIPGRPVRQGTFIPNPPVPSSTQERTLNSFRLQTAVLESNLLRASSDTSRVRVRRVDPQTGKRLEWTINILPGSDYVANHDLFLRDADVIEIPEKQ